MIKFDGEDKIPEYIIFHLFFLFCIKCLSINSKDFVKLVVHQNNVIVFTYNY